MAKSRTTKDRSQKSGARSRKAAKKVWHITDFDEIFKLADDKRKGRVGPLAYTKSFVSLSGSSKPCESHHWERLNALKARPERHLLRSVFEDIKNWAAYKPQHHQGYLVTTDGKPAGADYIAAQLDNVDKTDIQKALPILARLGLIERVPLNGQLVTPKKPEIPNKDETNDGGSGGNDPPDSGEGRADSGNRPPEGKVSGNGKSFASAKESRVKGNDKDSPAQEGKASQAPTAPAAAPSPDPKDPTEPDALGSKVSPFTGGPSGSVKTIRGPTAIGDILDGKAHRYDPEAQAFAKAIYDELGLPMVRGSPMQRDEWESFASVWMDHGKGLPQRLKTEIQAKALVHAARVRKNRKKCDSVGAVWVNIFQGLVRNYRKETG